jgi:hypothetical protein
LRATKGEGNETMIVLKVMLHLTTLFEFIEVRTLTTITYGNGNSDILPDVS